MLPLEQYRTNFKSLPCTETALLTNFLLDGDPVQPYKKRKVSSFGSASDHERYGSLLQITGTHIQPGIYKLHLDFYDLTQKQFNYLTAALCPSNPVNKHNTIKHLRFFSSTIPDISPILNKDLVSLVFTCSNLKMQPNVSRSPNLRRYQSTEEHLLRAAPDFSPCHQLESVVLSTTQSYRSPPCFENNFNLTHLALNGLGVNIKSLSFLQKLKTLKLDDCLIHEIEGKLPKGLNKLTISNCINLSRKHIRDISSHCINLTIKWSEDQDEMTDSNYL